MGMMGMIEAPGLSRVLLEVRKDDGAVVCHLSVTVPDASSGNIRAERAPSPHRPPYTSRSPRLAFAVHLSHLLYLGSGMGWPGETMV